MHDFLRKKTEIESYLEQIEQIVNDNDIFPKWSQQHTLLYNKNKRGKRLEGGNHQMKVLICY